LPWSGKKEMTETCAEELRVTDSKLPAAS
jgi:hypothetical protein